MTPLTGQIIGQNRTLRLALASVIAVGLLSAPAVAWAAPATSTPVPTTTIERAKAAEAEARAVLEQTRIDLQTLVAEYIEMGEEIEQTKLDVVDVTNRIAAMQVQLDDAELALSERVVELYRSDRDSMLRLLFTSKSIQDLWIRSSYLAKINFRDSRLVNEVRLARQENLWLQQSLYDKMGRLETLQRDADLKRVKIEEDLKAQEERAAQLRVDLARLMWSPSNGSAPEGGFSPETVMSEAQFRDSAAMTVADIQSFLEGQPGSLDTYKAKDHSGVMKPASQIIGEAAVAWGVNPKVILCVLQKEQSLLERPNPTQRAYEWAMGCGCPDSGVRYTKYQGFGNQVWGGAEKLAKNGGPWHPGITMKIDGSTIHPTNAATYSLYKYTPHFRGTMSFWMLYWRYFGDPTA